MKTSKSSEAAAKKHIAARMKEKTAGHPHGGDLVEAAVKERTRPEYQLPPKKKKR